MYYEPSYKNSPNYFLIFVLIISVCIIVGYVYTHGQKPIEPIIKNESKMVQIEYVTVIVTPTPDGKLYYANEFDNGIRKIQNPFSFFSDNATGLKDLKITSMVYDYKIYNKLHWYNPSDGLYYEMSPSKDMKYLFVFFASYMDDVTADDTRFYIPNTSNYVIQSIYKNDVYTPIEYPKQIRFTEMEYSKDFKNRESAQYYGGIRSYTRSIDYKNSAGEIFIETNVLRGGESNYISGYLLYEIPKEMYEQELIFGVNYYAYGNAWWRLKPE